MSEGNKDRILWVDAAKGLGVYLVVLGHLWYVCVPEIVNQAIYAFHMPLFFILSGFVFNTGRKSGDLLGFVSTKAKRLLVPTAMYIILFVIIYVPLKWNELDAGESVQEILFLNGKCFYNDPCWFFITLFQIYVVMYLIKIQKMKPVMKAAVMIIFALAGYFVYTNSLIPFFGIDRAVISSCFFAAGNVAREIYENRNMTKTVHVLIFVLSLFLFVIFGLYINGKISFYNRSLDHYYAFLLSGIFGSVIFCYICSLISHCRIARYLTIASNNSVFIVGTHYIGVDLFRTFAKALNIDDTWYISISAIVFTILLVEIYRHLCRFLDVRFPVFTGKKA